MCGIVGIVAKTPVNQDIYDALTLLQHRGQDAAGIMTSDGSRFFLRKADGLVRDAIQARHIVNLAGNVGVGHVRYPTAGTLSAAEAQPLYVNSPYGLGIVHNGNLTNTEELKHDLMVTDLRHLNTDSDSEVLLNVFAHELQRLAKIKPTPADIFQAVEAVHRRCRGAYAAIIIIAGYGMVAFRDPYGIRPAIYGSRETDQGTEYMVASESVALDALNFEVLGDILPGEAVLITNEGQLLRQLCAEKSQLSPCLFELVYLARPDSRMDGISVYQMRLELGKSLAKKIQATYPDHDIDVVIPVPDTSRSAALSLAEALNLPYREGFVKNRYIGRTFIMPGQAIRRKSVRQKLNAITSEFKDKIVLLVDDSIVRGTTSKEIIQMARDAGAKKVYFASAAPEVRYPNVYGIDMPNSDELIAHNRTTEEVRALIGADWLIYQDLEALYHAAQQGNPDIIRFEDSVFSGDYVTNDISPALLERIAKRHSESAQPSATQIIEVYNNS